jgi:acyl-coenzyme A thioesterase PaaI-like protein
MTTSDERRAETAALLRELGHDYVARDLSDADLDEVAVRIRELLGLVRGAPLRVRTLPSGTLEHFKLMVPDADTVEKHQLFTDSFVSGGANPMGLGAVLWREGETAVMEAKLGKAFEGAPGRAHGGVVAALVDETMGLVMALQGALAFTAQLDITYLEPTPVAETITARAWLESHEGRKLTIKAVVRAADLVVCEATGLFVSVNPTKFLAHLAGS